MFTRDLRIGLAKRCLSRFQSTQEAPIIRATNTLKKPQFPLKQYYEIEQYELYKNICLRRNVPFTLGPQTTYTEFRSLNNEIDSLRKEAKMNQEKVKSIATSKDGDKSLLPELKKQMAKFKALLAEKERDIKQFEDKMLIQVEGLPNLIDPSVSQEQILVKYLNPTSELSSSQEADYPLTANDTFDHKTIMEELNLIDFDNASRVSGRGWYYLLGDAALLEQALIQYALSRARSHGFKMITPPSIVKTELTNACGFKPRDTNGEKQVYELTDEDRCLTGTAEIPLAALYSSQTMPLENLPLRHVGISRSYRAEAGANGRDTRGLYRVHEFNKVELFVWTEDSLEASNAEFDNIVNFQIDMIESLGLTARVLLMPSDDLGAPAYKKIDIEAMMPGRGKWGEVSSTSNCLDYQSRRLATKYRDPAKEKPGYVYTLNGTACAVPRLIVAIVENFYDPVEKCIVVPQVLRKYMDGMEKIYKN